VHPSTVLSVFPDTCVYSGERPNIFFSPFVPSRATEWNGMERGEEYGNAIERETMCQKWRLISVVLRLLLTLVGVLRRNSVTPRKKCFFLLSLSVMGKTTHNPIDPSLPESGTKRKVATLLIFGLLANLIFASFT
jgi:hypothetical protein